MWCTVGLAQPRTRTRRLVHMVYSRLDHIYGGRLAEKYTQLADSFRDLGQILIVLVVARGNAIGIDYTQDVARR